MNSKWHWAVIYLVTFVLLLFFLYTILGLDVVDLIE